MLSPEFLIAMPSLSNHQRFGEGCHQLAKTNVRVHYIANPAFIPTGVVIAFKYGTNVQSFPLSGYADLSNPYPDGSRYADIELDLDDAWAADGTVNIDVTLKAIRDVTGEPHQESADTREVNGRCLITNLEFSPKAYNDEETGEPIEPVCPYTHKQAAFSGTDEWYGLLTTYELGGITLDRLDAMVSCGDMGGMKLLAVPSGALDGTNCKIKWEGYDWWVPEPAELPVCVFPADLSMQYAPLNVVAEDRYYYKIRANDSRAITDPVTTFYQSYLIDTIPITVQYNMTDTDIPLY